VNARQRRHKDSGDLDTAQIPSGEHENSGIARSKRGNFQRTISQSLILGQHDPATFADLPEPYTVVFVASKIVVVNFDREVGFDEFRSDWLYAKRPVDEEYRLIRRLRSGLLLRLH